jgi:hypothetical protein
VRFVVRRCFFLAEASWATKVEVQQEFGIHAYIVPKMTSRFWQAIVDLPEDLSVVSGTWLGRSLKAIW